MKTLAKTILISAALTVSLSAGAAFADGKCSDCGSGYYNKISACGDDAMNIEARELCMAIAQSNLDSCNRTCSYQDNDDDRESERN
jgi:hypothetical protein